MACDDDIHAALPVKGQELVLVARCIHEGTTLIIYHQGMALGVAAPEDEPYPAFLKVEQFHLLEFMLCVAVSSRLDDLADQGNRGDVL
jgi:hypothetical protein